MDMVSLNSQEYDQLSMGVRIYCAQQLRELLDRLRPYVDGSFGDISPGHAQVFVGAVRDLGRLYQVQRGPREDKGIPAGRVEKMIEQAVQEAVQRALADQRQALEASQRLELESARTQLATSLEDVLARG